MGKSTQPCIPDNMSEDEVVKIINRVAKSLSTRFKFGYHETKDMEQEARLIAWKGMANYDGVRPLENYLWAHVHNRLFNFKRDNYFRPYCPCLKCKYNDDSGCDKYDSQNECSVHRRWENHNTAKLNVIHPLEFSMVDDQDNNLSNHSIAEESVSCEELKQLLNKYLPLEYRHNYLRLVYGCKLLTKYRVPLLEVIRNIIKEHYEELHMELYGEVNA